MLEEMKALTKDVLGIDLDGVDADTCLADLGIDSMDTVELFMAFEDAFGVEFPEDFAPETVHDILFYVEEALPEDEDMDED